MRDEHEIELGRIEACSAEERKDDGVGGFRYAAVDEHAPFAVEKVLRERPRPEDALDPVDAGGDFHWWRLPSGVSAARASPH